jgi:hypothetical protein
MAPVAAHPEQLERQAWINGFEAAARGPLRLRMRYGFIEAHHPVMDDERFRASLVLFSC